MNIDTNIYKQYVKSGQSRRCLKMQPTAQKKQNTIKTDSFSLSPEASMFKECGKVIKRSIAEITAPASEDRINSLRQQIKADSYNIPSDKIAGAILDRIV